MAFKPSFLLQSKEALATHLCYDHAYSLCKHTPSLMKHHFFHAEVGFAIVVLKLDQQEVHVTMFLFAYLCLLPAKKKILCYIC